ncbi:hypothetical protein T484DRAFT_1940246 [Baffinella frigidus]|nr:hypothetical protein T484DRAFT_1940246 [Cryptophyta sp. CCMP2293]
MCPWTLWVLLNPQSSWGGMHAGYFVSITWVLSINRCLARSLALGKFMITSRLAHHELNHDVTYEVNHELT